MLTPFRSGECLKTIWILHYHLEKMMQSSRWFSNTFFSGSPKIVLRDTITGECGHVIDYHMFSAPSSIAWSLFLFTKNFGAM